jgi:glutamate racemase
MSAFDGIDLDTLILGCTHYPVISEAIRRVIGYDVHLINSGKETAFFAKDMLVDLDLLRRSDEMPRHRYFISDEPQMFSQIAKIFLGETIDDKIEKIDIEVY